MWCPEHATQDVHQALRNEGARASWTLPVAQGAHCTPWNRPKHPAVVLAAGRSSRMKQGAELKEDHWSEEDRAALAQRSKAMLPVEASGRPFLALCSNGFCAKGWITCAWCGLAKTKTCPLSSSHGSPKA